MNMSLMLPTVTLSSSTCFSSSCRTSTILCSLRLTVNLRPVKTLGNSLLSLHNKLRCVCSTHTVLAGQLLKQGGNVFGWITSEAFLTHCEENYLKKIKVTLIFR